MQLYDMATVNDQLMLKDQLVGRIFVAIEDKQARPGLTYNIVSSLLACLSPSNQKLLCVTLAST